MTPSLASRLQLAVGIVGGLLLGLACIVLAFLIQRTLLAEFDAGLATEAKALSVLVEWTDEGLVSEIRERQPEQYERSDDPHYYQLRDGSGNTVERSLNLGQNDLPGSPLAKPSTQFVNLHLPNGRTGRAVVLLFAPHSEASDPTAEGGGEIRSLPPSVDRSASLTIARETSNLQRAIDQTRLQLGIVFAGALGVLLLTVRPLVAFGLQPLKATTQQIEAIDEHNLDSRIDVQPPRELEPVITRLNGLLSRIEAAFQRERTLSANIAHELRTPLAGIHATIDVAISRERSDAELREALAESLRICRETEGIVENLLALSRIDAGKEAIRRKEFDLVELIDDVWAINDAHARRRNVSLTWQLPPAAPVEADLVKVKLVLTNLFQNAVAYVNDGGAIEISIQSPPQRIELRVANTGSELTQNDAELAFDRFWRGETARSQTGQHAGLGLALCRDVAKLLNATISATSVVSGEFAVTLSLPNETSE